MDATRKDASAPRAGAKERRGRDFDAMERRRRQGMALLARGLTQAEVARRLGVTRQSVSEWERMRRSDPGGWRRRRLGRPPGLKPPQLARLAAMIRAGAPACGYASPKWTLARVAGLIEREFGRSYTESHVWRLLRSAGVSIKAVAVPAAAGASNGLRQADAPGPEPAQRAVAAVGGRAPVRGLFDLASRRWC